MMVYSNETRTYVGHRFSYEQMLDICKYLWPRQPLGIYPVQELSDYIEESFEKIGCAVLYGHSKSFKAKFPDAGNREIIISSGNGITYTTWGF